MLTIGITGSKGFIGTHLFNTLSLYPNEYRLIEINRKEWSDNNILFHLVNQCDVLFHLSGVNRNESADYIYNENIRLASVLLEALYKVSHPIQLIFSSSLQENNGSSYGKGKNEARQMLEKWSIETNNQFFGILIPNVFGPFGKPFYNSFIATFCHQINLGEEPIIATDAMVPLIYVADLVSQMIELIKQKQSIVLLQIKPKIEVRVSEVLSRLLVFKQDYLQQGKIPELPDQFSVQLFNTFRSYLDYGTTFPKTYISHTDARGSFVELIRLGSGGQVSFSTTHPGITRGNHFHTRKIERFSVIKGKAKMELRRYGQAHVDTFYLDGDAPAYVDIPIWYYHNITNVGQDILYTIFWISEQYDPTDADTYFEST
jgi:UDP-2-acetamido-2,6-beta-L-arabino-hexul-4-ose reductase